MPRDATERADALRAALRIGGLVCGAVAFAVFALGLVIYVSGYEVAFVLMVAGLAVFVLTIGLLAASRRV